MGDLIAERRQALETRWGAWTSTTLSGRFDMVAERFGDRPFVITDEATQTYAEVAAQSQRIAGGLADLGVRRGDRVAILIDNRAEFVPVKIAVARAGAVAVPLNFQYKAEELQAALAHSEAKVLVTIGHSMATDFLDALDAIAPGWETAGGGATLPTLEYVVVVGGGRDGALSLTDVAARGTDITPPETDPDSICDIVFTSGTSGHPLAAMLTHDMVLRSAYGSAYHRGFADGWRICFALPMYHVFGYVEGLLAAMFVGGAVVPRQVFNPRTLLEAVAREHVNEVLFVPTMTVGVVEEAAQRAYDLSSLESVFSAAAPAPVWLWERVQRELAPRTVYTGYGQTEVSAATALTMPGDALEVVSETVGACKLGGAAATEGYDGRLAQYRTVDPFTGEPLPDGAEGELSVRGPIVTRAYHADPERTAGMIEDGWLRTGDLGSVGADGYLRLTGRARELYKCGGELVAPKEVEDVINRFPGVGQAYVAGVPDERMGEVGAAWVVPDGDAVLDPEVLRRHCRTHLAAFKIPRMITIVAAADLPTTATGKVQKYRLAQSAVTS
ncbi:fatty-acyl-CoA synthase [Antricoccus suffuscus]|uniref:Fatty-acyl-CoA synthase n=1 Tax=Antricoccus suffuscus TaxID=1629062 RepID=A0A2T1A2A6_9ACTN|nr:AMP-binding protein [Antricoccus suffuscus]PRZ42732.1 fatty-acyl-CoA synthase [Antricoccus suffuscus]